MKKTDRQVGKISQLEYEPKFFKSIFTFQICELTYEKQIDFSTVDLKKLKVKDLKKILSEWDEVNDQKHCPSKLYKFFQECDGCLEKGDFIKRIEELKPKHVRTEL